MSNILQDLSEAASNRAIEQNLFDFMPFFAFCDQGEVHDTPELLWSISNLAFPIFNCSMRARLPADRVDQVIEAVIARGRARNVPVLWWTGPMTRPENLGDALQAHGFMHEGEVPGMAMDLRLLPHDLPRAEGLAIELSPDPEALQGWRQAFADSFEMPDFAVDGFMAMFHRISLEDRQVFQHVLVRQHGKPVGVGSMFLSAGVAGVYNIGTVPAARRQGIGSLLTHFLLSEAVRLGYRVGVLHSSPMGRAVYASLGFRQTCSLGQYVWSP